MVLRAPLPACTTLHAPAVVVPIAPPFRLPRAPTLVGDCDRFFAESRQAMALPTGQRRMAPGFFNQFSSTTNGLMSA